MGPGVRMGSIENLQAVLLKKTEIMSVNPLMIDFLRFLETVGLPMKKMLKRTTALHLRADMLVLQSGVAEITEIVIFSGT